MRRDKERWRFDEDETKRSIKSVGEIWSEKELWNLKIMKVRIEDKERFESWFDEAKFLVSFVRINDFYF